MGRPFGHVEMVRNRHQQIEVFGVVERDGQDEGGYVFGVKTYHRNKTEQARRYAQWLATNAGLTQIEERLS
jgi:hypothetical protein